MDLASVVAALASVGVRVSGSNPNNNIQGDSSRACPTGLAGPEPSGTHNDPGQHFQLFTAHPELRAFVSVYIDDIIIATEGEGLTEAELVALHEKQLNQVLDILDANQLICGPKKGKLFLKSVEFCGSLLENGTRRPSPGKLVAIQKWKRPETITELRGFLG